MENIYAIYQRAFQLYEFNRFDEAGKLSKEILAIKPDYIPAHHLLLHIALAENEPSPLLIKKAKQLLSFSPEDDLAFYAIGAAHYHKDQYDKADQFLKKALEIDPENIDYLILLAENNRMDNKNWVTTRLVKKALSIDPKNKKALQYKASIEMSNSGYGNARDSIKQLLEQNPDDASNHLLAGQLALANMDIQNAEQHYQTAILLDPSGKNAKIGYLNSIAAKNPIFKLALSKYGVFEGRHHILRLIFIICFNFILFVNYPDSGNIWKNIFFISAFSLQIINWFILPLSRSIIAYRKWRTLHFDWWSIDTFLFSSILSVISLSIALFIFKIELLTSIILFIGIYGLVTYIVISGAKSQLMKRIGYFVFGGIYTLAGGFFIYYLLGNTEQQVYMVLAFLWIGFIVFADLLKSLDQSYLAKEKEA